MKYVESAAMVACLRKRTNRKRIQKVIGNEAQLLTCSSVCLAFLKAALKRISFWRWVSILFLGSEWPYKLGGLSAGQTQATSICPLVSRKVMDSESTQSEVRL